MKPVQYEQIFTELKRDYYDVFGSRDFEIHSVVAHGDSYVVSFLRWYTEANSKVRRVLENRVATFRPNGTDGHRVPQLRKHTDMIA